ncbi:ABC transporter ATP-binding protein [Oscillatoriales cyanobacterium LEGE 11467]|uniref:ABC transporter ATP-binding protein n=1 Tax=Zarconia navalis LEGE 11467 TaxID=1828826 RepID=A0A928VS56_9CYAN|nr:ABC transporter ATP-binding protein [Zarconia navalis]MBE9039394.1 ABC transporter ATP-binding protein [Zarconia navalis LEGE 11467]
MSEEMICETLFLKSNQVSHFYENSSGNCTQALQDVSIEMQSGEILAIVGASGCGKSTLLRILAGLVQPTEGNVTIEGISPLKYQRSQKISFAFQKPLLFPWRTTIQNIMLPMEIVSRSITLSEASKDYDRALYLIKTLGLSGFENCYPHQLSGGMLQRAAIARALMTEPKLLLLDEPFSALDEITRENLWIDFSRIWRTQNLSVVLVTHSTQEAVFLSDRVCVMSHRPGTIQAVLPIDLPSFRDRETMMKSKFLELCEKVKNYLS